MGLKMSGALLEIDTFKYSSGSQGKHGSCLLWINIEKLAQLEEFFLFNNWASLSLSPAERGVSFFYS